jgi:hypothetical protein
MSQNDSDDVLAILFEKIEVWDTNINAIGSLFRKAHARVEDEHFIPVSHSHAVHPKLADTAERNDF